MGVSVAKHASLAFQPHDQNHSPVGPALPRRPLFPSNAPRLMKTICRLSNQPDRQETSLALSRSPTGAPAAQALFRGAVSICARCALPAKTHLQSNHRGFITSSERFAMSDQDIQQLESQFPAVSGQAFAAAREQVLASGQSVLQSQDGVIYEIFPDGHMVAVKKIEPPTRFVSGTIFTLR